jgi:hypothetical protein
MGYGLDNRGSQNSSPGRITNFHSSILSRLALGSTQPLSNIVQTGSGVHPTPIQYCPDWLWGPPNPYPILSRLALGSTQPLSNIVQTGSGVHPTSYPILSRLALGSTQPLSNGSLSLGVKWQEQEAHTTHLQLVPRSRKHGSIHPLSHTPPWCSA